VRLRIGIPALQRRESEESQEEFGGRVEKRNSFHSIARLSFSSVCMSAALLQFFTSSS
jgi:hypothetical protein